MTKSGGGILMSVNHAFLCALAAVDRFVQTQPATAPSTPGARMFAKDIHAGGVDGKTALHPSQSASLSGVPFFVPVESGNNL